MNTSIELSAPVVHVEVAGETLVIKPFTFGQLPTVAKRIANIATALGGADATIPTLLAEGGEDIMHIIALACGKPRTWLDTLEADQGMELLTAVVTLNKDQFTKKLMPALQKLGAGLAKNQAAA